MAKILTTKSVEAMRPGAARVEVPDGGLPGLYLVVQPSGAKSWAFRTRVDGKPRKLTLGRHPAVSLAAARAAAREAAQAVALGRDPAAERRTAREEAPLRTVAAQVAEFDKRHLCKLRSGAKALRVLELSIVAAWGARPVESIARRDVVQLLDRIHDARGPGAADRARTWIAAFFGWLVRRDMIAASPATGVRPPAQPVTRSRVLDDTELRLVWRAADALSPPAAAALRMLILTGQRHAEVLGMTHAELDGDTWIIPGSRAKNGTTHAVPLSPEAQKLIAGLPRIAGGYVFTLNSRNSVTLDGRTRGRLDAEVTRLAAAEGRGPVPHWTVHDLRRSAASGMARLGIGVHVVEKLLNHTSGTFSGITRVYQRHDFAVEKRAALDAWGRHVRSLYDPATASVLPFGVTAKSG